MKYELSMRADSLLVGILKTSLFRKYNVFFSGVGIGQ